MHIFLECPHPELCNLRARAQDELQRIAGRLLCALSPDAHLEAQVIHFILDHAFDRLYEDVHRIWLGTWNTPLLLRALRYGSITSIPHHFDYSRAMCLQQTIVNLTEHLVKTVAGMMRVYCQQRRSLPEPTASKRRRIALQEPYISVVAKAVFPPPKVSAPTRKMKARCVSKTSRRQKLVSKKRKLFSTQDVNSIEAEPMDIVGYVSHPWGQTQSCDHDRD